MSGPCEALSASNLAPVFEPPCLKLVISKSLGYAIVAGSAGVKLPQVFNIVKAKSVDGLSGTSLLIEWVSSVSSLSYYAALGYPFSTWGENFFLFFQNAIITALYLSYTVGLRSGRFVLTVLASAALGTALYLRALPDVVLPEDACAALGLARCRFTCADLAGGLPAVLMIVGRLPQIVQNLRQGHTGTLSLITYLLNVLGGTARIFTTLQELGDDKLVLCNVVSGLLQNAVILSQILTLGPGGKKGAAAKVKKGA